MAGGRSKLSLLRIMIYSSLTATPASIRDQKTSSNTTLAIEGTSSAITLRGSDSSETPRILKLQIVKLPSAGDIYFSSDAIKPTLLGVDSFLPSMIPTDMYTRGVPVYYVGKTGFFTSPKRMFNGTLINPILTTPDAFQFRVLSPDNSYSAAVTQYVTVINVNDPTEIDVSKLSSSPKVKRL